MSIQDVDRLKLPAACFAREQRKNVKMVCTMNNTIRAHAKSFASHLFTRNIRGYWSRIFCHTRYKVDVSLSTIQYIRRTDYNTDICGV